MCYVKEKVSQALINVTKKRIRYIYIATMQRYDGLIMLHSDFFLLPFNENSVSDDLPAIFMSLTTIKFINFYIFHTISHTYESDVGFKEVIGWVSL